MAISASDRAARRTTASRGDRRPVGGVRWDRITRWALLLVVAVLLMLYVGPVRSYFSASARATDEQAKVHQLKAEHQRLLARKAQLRAPSSVEAEARAKGYVKPGEKPYVVSGLSGER